MSKKQKKQGDFIKKAFYKGGSEAMKDFILSNLKYPEEAATNKIEGTVHLRYHINQRGIVFKAEALTKFGHGLEKEAIRLVRLLRFEVPKNKRNLKLIFNKTTSIHFRLPKNTPAPIVEETPKIEIQPPVEQVQYTITTTKKTEEKTEEPPQKAYTYTIKL